MCVCRELAGWWWWWCTPSRAHHATDTGRGPARPGRRGPVAAARLRRAPPSGPAPAAASACGPRLSCYPRHPPLRGTTEEAFGFNKPLEIVKPKVSGGGWRLCCVWSLAVKLIQCKLNPASAHGAVPVLSAAAPNDQSAKSAYPVQGRFYARFFVSSILPFVFYYLEWQQTRPCPASV